MPRSRAPPLLLLFMLIGLLSSTHGAVTVGVGKCFTREGLLGFTQRGVCVATTHTYGATYERPSARRAIGVGIRTSVHTLSCLPQTSRFFGALLTTGSGSDCFCGPIHAA